MQDSDSEDRSSENSSSEEFKKPTISGLLLPPPPPARAGLGKKVKSAKPQLEFIQMMQYNNDPLNRQGRPLEVYTMEEIAKHKTAKDAWIVINRKVYDITMYADYHPGGKILLTAAGKDGTHLFTKYHPWVNLDPLIGKLQIGTLANSYGLI